MLDKKFFSRETNITARVICDSIGCVITDKVKNTSVVIGSRKDAEAVIESLQRLINCWYEDK